MLRAIIKNEIEKHVPHGVVFAVDFSDEADHGDYASNVALISAKQMKRPPREVAEDLAVRLTRPLSQCIEKIEVAGPGFLNFYIDRKALYAAIEKISFRKKLSFSSRLNPSRVRAGSDADSENGSFLLTKRRLLKINIEFVSANPTGPLTMANGRGGFCGDVLANILERAGHRVTREYYINDAGNQIKLLGESISAAEGKIPDREELYKGEYIKELQGKTAKQAVAVLLKNIKRSLKSAGIKYDVWFSEEQNLHKKKELKKTLEFLLKKKILKESEGALWLGDPQQGGAVLIKSDGSPTYFLADLAYHYDKFIKRKFDIAINIWGADHHGYVARMKGGVGALGVDPGRLQIIIMQLVRLMSGGKEMRMSKRAGNFVTMDELLEMAGADAARWFFLERSSDTHMDFDLDLARERSKKNPVYYVQYAHARACSILSKSKQKAIGKKIIFSLLSDPYELALIKKILQLPEIVGDIADDYNVQRLPKYAYDLARTFSEFYEHCKVIDPDNKELTAARLALVRTARDAIADVLSLMGISAPKKM